MHFVENREKDAGNLSRITEIESQKQQIASPVDQAPLSQLDTAELEAAVVGIRSERDSLADELRIIKSERQRFEVEREQLKSSLVKAESDRERLITERDQLSGRLVRNESEQELLITEREQLRSSLAKAETERERLASEQAQTDLNLQASNARGDRLTGEQTELRTSLQMANDKLERLVSERISLRGNLTAAIKERERLAAELESMLDARRQLSSDLQKTKKERDQLRLSLDQQIKIKKTELAESAGLVVELTDRLDDAVQIIDQLQALVQALSQEKDDVETRFSDLKTKLETGLQPKNVEIEQQENDRTVIRVTGDILFDAGSAELSDAGHEALGHIAAALIGFPNHQVSLEGHTDTVPITGTLRQRYATNWELSVARAASAVRYLQLQGIDAARLRAVGYGEFRPVVDNDDPQLRERNRRLEIRLLPGDGTELEQDLRVRR